jgi:hypothetical protein
MSVNEGFGGSGSRELYSVKAEILGDFNGSESTQVVPFLEAPGNVGVIFV